MPSQGVCSHFDSTEAFLLTYYSTLKFCIKTIEENYKSSQ